MNHQDTSTHTGKPAAVFFKLFWVAYFFLYAFPFPLNFIPFLSTLSRWYFQVVAKVVIWTGTLVYHAPYTLLVNSDGSSDTTFNYIWLSVIAASAAAITSGVIAYKPPGPILNRFVRAGETYIRYYLAFTLLRYGAEKIIKVQFPFPYYNLNESYGESSPLRLFKSFMGFSLWYNVFLGLSEAVAALLLLFRKTKPFGALLSFVILTNIVVLNFTFDLSVKMISLILLGMSLFILLSDKRGLFEFYHHYSVYAKAETRSGETTGNWIKGRKIWLTVIPVCICYSIITRTWHLYQTTGDGAFNTKSLPGTYNTQVFVKNGDTLLPLLTDTFQWKALTIGNQRQALLKKMNDSTAYCNVLIDTSKKNITITDKENATYKSQLHYSFSDSTHLVLTGQIRDDSVYILMHKQDYRKYRLINRGFHWVNEYPYNK